MTLPLKIFGDLLRVLASAALTIFTVPLVVLTLGVIGTITLRSLTWLICGN